MIGRQPLRTGAFEACCERVIVSVAVIIATGLNAVARREILGMEVRGAEAGDSWMTPSPTCWPT
ncbi:MAG: hypothetical protein EOR08_16790 [Mesorhizobium sp.]|nr:MAG: hypothetical protein EOR08_16790 [Mesorhizobium sp.]